MIRVEFIKQVRRARTYIALGVLALIPVIMTVALKLNPPSPSSNEHGYFEVATHSGINVPLAALTATSAFLLVIVVSLFAGETVSGEATWGTLRYLLVRPVSRPRLLASKLLVASTLSIVATVVISVVALVAGIIAFGWHPVLTPSFVVVSQTGTLDEVLGHRRRYDEESLRALAGDCGFEVEHVVHFNRIGTLAWYLNGKILRRRTCDDCIYYNRRTVKKSFVFPTHYIDAWHGLFFQPARTGDMVHGVLLELPYLAVFLGLAWWNFLRKDVLS